MALGTALFAGGGVLAAFWARRCWARMREAEDALRKFRRVVEQTPSAVVITDRDGTIEYVNPRFTAVSGYGAQEAIGRKPSLLKSGETPSEVYRELWKTISGGGVWRGEFHNRRKDGSLYWESATISPVRDSGGEITHYAGVKVEITASKEMEEKLADAQRMEAIARLAGSVAHDFNNLLAVIAGNLELILQRTQDPAIATLARPALDASEAGAAYTRRLLSLSARRQAAASLFAPNARISGIKMLLERVAGAGIAWTYRLEPDLWPVEADPGEVDSALLNLTTNSRDAMPEGGVITLATRNICLDAAQAAALSREGQAGDYVCIEMSDSGLGMRKEVLSRAFEPFFTTKSEGKGAGLGLSGVQNFVHRAGGFATLVSHEGDGTTVSLYLPRAAAPAEAPAESAPPLGDGQVVLIVDDDERVREVTAKRVEALGYVAETARSVAEAVAILESGLAVDLMFSDIVMPGGMNGFDLVRWTQANKPGVGVALTTGFNGGFQGDDAAALGAPLLQKPFTREQLARTLATALAQSGDASAAKT
jgi:two-component system, cell cycle sensor histidine kinase and response regulator CckA